MDLEGNIEKRQENRDKKEYESFKTLKEAIKKRRLEKRFFQIEKG